MFTSLCACEERNGNSQTDCNIDGTNQELLIVRAGVHERIRDGAQVHRRFSDEPSSSFQPTNGAYFSIV